jgi:hypothetical protein
MDGDKRKEGVSVKEMGDFAKKHRFEVFFCLAFILACFFSFVLWGPGWSVIAAAIGAIIGVLFVGKVTHLCKMTLTFVFKQEQTVQLVLGIVFLILAIFVPPLYFLLLGLHGGKDMQHWAMEIYSQYSRK